MTTVSQEILITRWNETADKVVQLADEFPAEHYEFVPSPDVRTFAGQARHVAFWNQYLAATLRGESPDGSANELPPAEFGDKPRIVSALRDSFGAVASAVAASDDGAADVIAYIGHNGEHYGQMVMYYRLNGLVPPASR
jgi:hypothetical protein